MVELVKEEKNVIVFRIFFKVYGLVGVRMGYFVVCLDIVDCIWKKRMLMFNVLVINVVKVVLEDGKFY